MDNVRNELQHIIFRDESTGEKSKLKKVQAFLRRHAEAGFYAQKHEYLKGEEEAQLIAFAAAEQLVFDPDIDEGFFISAGAEQRVYRFDDYYILKTNDSIFYAYWLDYFNSLLLHNFFFPTTAYEFLGLKTINGVLHAVVKQEFITATEPTDLKAVKQFLEYNGFRNTRNNDYINTELGIIFEDLHDENVLSHNRVLFFIDTVFYLTDAFYR